MEVVKKQNYEQAAELKRQGERKLLSKLEQEKIKFEEQLEKEKQIILLEHVYDVVSNMTKIPVNKMSVDDTKALIDLDKSLIDKVIGQNDAVVKIAKSIKTKSFGY